MKINIFLLLFIVAILLYICSPEQYSFSFCLVLHNLFIFSSLLLLYRDKHNEKVGFNFLFSISFYFTNFVYPVFIYPIAPDFSLFSFGFNSKVISECTALAFVAYSAYAWGYTNKMVKYPQETYIPQFVVAQRAINWFITITVIYIILFSSLGGYKYFQDRYLDGVMSVNMTLQYLLQFFPVLLTYLVCFIILCREKVSKLLMLVILIYFSFTLLISGSRVFVLSTCSMLFFTYCLQKKVNYIYINSSVVFGILLMAFIGMSRNSGDYDLSNISENSVVGIWSNFTDLIVNNRNLYTLYEFASSETYTYGVTMLAGILAPIPLLQGIIQSILNIPDYLMNSAYFSTFLTFGTNPPMGMGTNLVGDTYVSFGVIGTIILFYIIGAGIISIRNGLRRGSLYCFLTYLVLVGEAVFFVRNSYFASSRVILWTLLVGYVIYKHIRFIKKCKS